MFHATIAENIRYARPEATDDDVQIAARAAGLDEFIGRLPDGYATIVGERGAALSAGERQRLAIARALVADPTCSFSTSRPRRSIRMTERQVIAEYRRLMHGRTVIVITHRAAVADAADRVLTLAGGTVVERAASYVL